MPDFFAGLGGKLAEKWASVLVLPGLLFVGVAAAAATLDSVTGLRSATCPGGSLGK